MIRERRWSAEEESHQLESCVSVLNFELSLNRDNIYYRHMFRISGKVWAIGGPGGKSEAARDGLLKARHGES